MSTIQLSRQPELCQQDVSNYGIEVVAYAGDAMGNPKRSNASTQKAKLLMPEQVSLQLLSIPMTAVSLEDV